MSGILCAIRGGPDSQPTIQKAIELSKEKKLPVFFLYVVNLDFLSHSSSSHLHTVSQEMNQMGESILLAAQMTAKAQGVEADGIVRKGNVQEEIIALCHELEITYLVLGQPHFQREEALFSQDLLNEFVERIEEQTGSKVAIAERGGS